MAPAGGLEGDESFEEVAVRETREETGINIAIIDLYKILHHIQVFEGGSDEWYLKCFSETLSTSLSDITHRASV